MPSGSSRRALAPLTFTEQEWRARLRRHIEALAVSIGGRTLKIGDGLEKTLQYLEKELGSYGLNPVRQTFRVGRSECHNLEVRGSVGSVVVGAHYDTVVGLPGANDNGSGVAAALELARELASEPSAPALRFVFFVNEEPPYFQTGSMGSYVYAKCCRNNGERIRAMLALETIGYYSDEEGSQAYPIGVHPGYPTRGDFLGFVSDFRSALLLRRVLKSFRSATALPAEGAAAPSGIPGMGWSDHWSFWQFGYRALMVTDTAPYRYPHYHTDQDTPDKLDYDRMARALTGLRASIIDLARAA
jgi:Zn-dependent M28 family amino/carboxypeptidase